MNPAGTKIVWVKTLLSCADHIKLSEKETRCIDMLKSGDILCPHLFQMGINQIPQKFEEFSKGSLKSQEPFGFSRTFDKRFS